VLKVRKDGEMFTAQITEKHSSLGRASRLWWARLDSLAGAAAAPSARRSDTSASPIKHWTSGVSLGAH